MFENPFDPQRRPPQTKSQTPNMVAAKALGNTQLKVEEQLQKKLVPQEQVSEKTTAQFKAIEQARAALRKEWNGDLLKTELESLIKLLADEIGWQLSKEKPIEFEELLQPLPEDLRNLARAALKEYNKWAAWLYAPCSGG